MLFKQAGGNRSCRFTIGIVVDENATLADEIRTEVGDDEIERFLWWNGLNAANIQPAIRCVELVTNL